MKRTYKSGAEKRQDSKRKKESIESMPKISSFLPKLKSADDQETIPPLSDSDDAEKIVAINNNNFNINETSQEDFLTQSFPENLQTSSDLNFDIANLTSSASNVKQQFLCSERLFPDNIALDFENRKFPTYILNKKLQNGESAERDWMWFSESTKSIYCASCVFAKDSENIFTTGWSAERGWRKLKDKVPTHENSSIHLRNYFDWKRAISNARNGAPIESFLFKNLQDETEKWKQILKRIVDVILFLSERGLAFFGDSHKIGVPSNGNFLGIIELLSKYDVILNEHVKKVQKSHEEGKKLQVHYLSNDIQNEFIQICGNMVQKEIISSAMQSKYFTIIADSTPDSSHCEQFSIVLRFINMNQSSFKIEERFIRFDEFYGKTGDAIAKNIVKLLQDFGLDFNNCIGGSFDNASNMSGKNSGVQAHLKNLNQRFVFSPCGNHTLNLVGNDATMCCSESIAYFAKFQSLFNFFSSSPPRWNILKIHLKYSLANVSKTRWYARFNAAKPIATNLNLINLALKEINSNLNLLAEAKHVCSSLIKFTSRYETVVTRFGFQFFQWFKTQIC